MPEFLLEHLERDLRVLATAVNHSQDEAAYLIHILLNNMVSGHHPPGVVQNSLNHLNFLGITILLT